MSAYCMLGTVPQGPLTAPQVTLASMGVAAGAETGPAFKAGSRKEGVGRVPGTRPGVATPIGGWAKGQKILHTY